MPTIGEIMAKLASKIREGQQIKTRWEAAEKALKAFRGSEAERQVLLEAAAKLKREWDLAQKAIASLKTARDAARAGQLILSGSGIATAFVILLAIGGGVYMYQNWGKPSSEAVKAGSMGDPAQRVLGGNTTLSWNWSVTTVEFAGNLSGGPNQWNFHGVLESGGNAIWHPEKGSGTANCTLTRSSEAKAQLKCAASFTQAEWVNGKWKQGNWVGEADGTMVTEPSGDKRRLGFRGIGWGDGGAGKAHIDHLDLLPRN